MTATINILQFVGAKNILEFVRRAHPDGDGTRRIPRLVYHDNALPRLPPLFFTGCELAAN